MKQPLSCAFILVLLIGACAALVGCSPFVFLNAAAAGKRFSTTTAVAYGTLPRQALDAYVPEAVAARPFPVVVFFYGAADATVSPGNSGRSVEQRSYPGIGHERVVGAFSPPLAHRLPVTDDVLRFIGQSEARDVSAMPRS